MLRISGADILVDVSGDQVNSTSPRSKMTPFGGWWGRISLLQWDPYPLIKFFQLNEAFIRLSKFPTAKRKRFTIATSMTVW